MAELQDQLRTAKEQGGRAATEEVLQQLNVVEAAYADLQEDMVGGWVVDRTGQGRHGVRRGWEGCLCAYESQTECARSDGHTRTHM